MIASIRGKKPHVYHVIILKQMADHTSGRLQEVKSNRKSNLTHLPKKWSR